MASLLLLICFLVVLPSNAQNIDYQKYPLVFETTKDASTLQYLTKVNHAKLVLDLNGPLAWKDCGSTSESFPVRPILRGSIQCLAAKSKSNPESGSGSGSGSGCGLLVENKIAGLRARGELVEDTLSVDLVDRSTEATPRAFLFACAPKPLLKGLAMEAKGMLGLGRARVSLPSQISSSLTLTMCLSHSNGVVLAENGRLGSYFGSEIFNSLVYTPLLTGEGESRHDYFIGLKSINIGGKRLSFDIKTTKLSTIAPYTTMQSSIYDTFAKAYERAALSMNMTRVESQSPFGLCFRPNGPNGPNGPEIDLVLQSELVKWRLNARNSLVRVSEQVTCLGFLDGGLDLEASIVFGGFQMEDMVLHFDLANSRLGFSPSLLKWQKSCSDFKLEKETTHVESI